MDDTEPGEARTTPILARALGFVAVLGLLAFLTLVVVTRDRDRQEAASGARPGNTVALPADNGGSITTTTPVPRPEGGGPTTVANGPRTNNEIALAIERTLKRDTGWTHKAWCTPRGPVEQGMVLECHASSEPPIKEAPPSDLVAVVVGQDGSVVWAQGTGEGFTLAGLTSDPDQTCDQLAARNYTWVQVLAYWEANGRPVALDPSGVGRPCSERYAASDIDAALAAAQ